MNHEETECQGGLTAFSLPVSSILPTSPFSGPKDTAHWQSESGPLQDPWWLVSGWGLAHTYTFLLAGEMRQCWGHMWQWRQFPYHLRKLKWMVRTERSHGPGVRVEVKETDSMTLNKCLVSCALRQPGRQAGQGTEEWGWRRGKIVPWEFWSPMGRVDPAEP